MNEGKKRCCGCDCGGPKKDRANLDTAGLEKFFNGRLDGAATAKGEAEKARPATEGVEA